MKCPTIPTTTEATSSPVQTWFASFSFDCVVIHPRGRSAFQTHQMKISTTGPRIKNKVTR